MIKLILLLTTFLCTVAASAQTTATSTATATTSTTKQDGRQTSHKSVSVSKSDNAYSLRADFDPAQYGKIRSVLSANLEKEYLSVSGTTLKWAKEEDSQAAYSFVLTDAKLKIIIYRELLSKAAFEKLSALADRVAEVISGN